MPASAALKKVQIARKELGLDDDTYRAMLERLTGVRSAADCTEAQLRTVLDELKVKGWTPKVIPGGQLRGRKGTIIVDELASFRPRRHAPADHPSAKKARALWLSLWNLGEIRDSSESALEAFARRQLGVERLQWADQALTYKLIEALKAMAERAGWSQDLSGLAPGADPVRVLKIALIKAQCRRLGLDPRSEVLGLPATRSCAPGAYVADEAARWSGVTHQYLDGFIAGYGIAIRASMGQAR